MQLTIPNIRATAWVEDRPIIPIIRGRKFLNGGVYPFSDLIDSEVREAAKAEERLRKRDWRVLRQGLLRLESHDKESVAKWLNAVGYAPSTQRPSWTADDVTDTVSAVLKDHRDICEWLLKLEIAEFKRATRAAFVWFHDKRLQHGARLDATGEGIKQPRLVPGEVEFYRRTRAPKTLRFDLLWIYLIGGGTAPTFSSSFFWDRDGSPSVAVHGSTPLEMIGLSIHIDRNFGVRQWITCAGCGKSFERTRGNGRFCGNKACKNLIVTGERRRKLKLVKDAESAWLVLPAEQRKGQDKWAWIVTQSSLASKGAFEIDPVWAKRQLTAKKERE